MSQAKTSFLTSSALAVLLLLGIACPSPPLPPVPPGPGPAPALIDAGTVAEAACANLARLQCPEGLRADCVPVVQKTIDTRITDLKLGCLIGAQTVAEVQACGSVSCK